VINIVDLPSRFQQTGALKVFQSGVMHAENKQKQPVDVATYNAKVVAVYTDRGTCDIQSSTELSRNVPISCKAYKDSTTGHIWGEIEYPQKGDWVLVQPLDRFNRKKLIIDTIAPYLMREFNDGQIPINSTNKSFTKKLLEAVDIVFRKIFRSGTSLEIQADGSYILETPSGSLFRIDEAGKQITLLQKDGTKTCIVTLSDTGFQVQDSGGNSIVSDTTAKTITVNGNFEVDQ